MSTTLVPPSQYLVKPRGRTEWLFPTIAQAATALARMAPIPATVMAVTGSRKRSLTDGELRELGRWVRRYRLSAASNAPDIRRSSV